MHADAPTVATSTTTRKAKPRGVLTDKSVNPVRIDQVPRALVCADLVVQSWRRVGSQVHGDTDGAVAGQLLKT